MIVMVVLMIVRFVALAVLLIAPPSFVATLPDRVELTMVSAPLLRIAPPSIALPLLKVRPTTFRLEPTLILNTRFRGLPLTVIFCVGLALIVRFLVIAISLASGIVCGVAKTAGSKVITAASQASAMI